MTEPSQARPPTQQDPVQSLLRARRSRLEARLQGVAPEAAQLWLASFELGGTAWAFPLEALRAALPVNRVTPVPLAPRHVVGLVRFEGEPVTVLSLGVLLGGKSWQRDPETLLVVAHAGHRLGLDCEQVPRPEVVPRAQVEAAGLSEGALWSEVVDGARRLRLIDLGRLLEEVVRPHGH
jgi:chemotaxis signal transduction protein